MHAPAQPLKPRAKLRVLVVDDHELFRICVGRTLEADCDMEVAAELKSGESITEAVTQSKPDVILLDLDMPGVDGVSALADLADNNVSCPVVILTAVEDRAQLRRAVDLGAVAIVFKGWGIADLKEAISEVHRGRKWISRALPELGDSGQRPVDEAPRPPIAGPAQMRRIERWTAPSWSRLTVREREIAELAAGGKRYADIARELGISEQTVKNHVRHVFDKLEVTNRLQLALFVASRRTC